MEKTFSLEHYSWYINVYLHVRNTKCIERQTFYIAYDNYMDFFLRWDIDVYYFQKTFFLNKSHWINSYSKKAIHEKVMQKKKNAAFFQIYMSGWWFFWISFSSHLHACESGPSQKSMLLKHSKCGKRKSSRPLCLLIYAIENF